MLRTTTHTDADKLPVDRGEWNKLLQGSAADSVFLSWEWLSAWLDAVRGKPRLFIITVRDGNDRLIGIAPLYFAEIRLLGSLRYRTLRYCADVATGAEYPDWIAERGREAEVSAAIAAELSRRSREWDLIWLTRISGWSGASERIASGLRDAGITVHERSHSFSALELPESLEDYELSFSAKRRQNMRRNTRRILSMDGVSLSRCETPDELSEYLDALFQLHQLRWSTAGIRGVFERKPAEARFYRRFCEHALERDWLRLFALRANGQIKAVQCGYHYDDQFLQLQEGYDPEFADGAGNALRHKVIEDCIDRGVRCYDFLGQHSEHKRRWGAEERLGHELLVVGRSVKCLPLRLREIWPSGRFMQQLGTFED